MWHPNLVKYFYMKLFLNYYIVEENLLKCRVIKVIHNKEPIKNNPENLMLMSELLDAVDDSIDLDNGKINRDILRENFKLVLENYKNDL